ncbi:MAG: pirin family protein [Asticcacaulis sp.]
MIAHLIDAKRKDLGGFVVARSLPVANCRHVGPFVFFDEMGPADWSPGFDISRDVRPHPHIGLSTLTYLFDGEITHRDSLGITQPIQPGAVNWMTSGRGIVHSERFETLRQHGGRIHGIQVWVALPDHLEACDPAFEHTPASALPRYEEAGLSATLVAGSAFGATSPVKVSSPLFYVHWDLKAGARSALPAEYPERGAYVVSGSVTAGGTRLTSGQMAVFNPGETIVFEAETDARLILIGGESVGDRVLWWNFVARDRQTIREAAADWGAQGGPSGRFALPEHDRSAFIPLPEGINAL